MHRILSYQTAMRAGDDRSIGQYITKRICISFVFSIGFFTLICGKNIYKIILINFACTWICN